MKRTALFRSGAIIAFLTALFLILFNAMDPQLILESQASHQIDEWKSLLLSDATSITLGTDLIPAIFFGPLFPDSKNRSSIVSINVRADPGKYNLLLFFSNADLINPPIVTFSLNGQKEVEKKSKQERGILIPTCL